MNYQENRNQCKFGIKCKFLQQNKCNRYHPPEHFENINTNNQQYRPQKQSYQQYRPKQQQQYYKKKEQNYNDNDNDNDNDDDYYQNKPKQKIKKEDLDYEKIVLSSSSEEEDNKEEYKKNNYNQDKNFQYNDHQRKPGQSLKDFYVSMLNKQSATSARAKTLEADLNPEWKKKEIDGELSKCQNDIGFGKEQQQMIIDQVISEQNLKEKVRIGIDFGNVICGADTQFSTGNDGGMFGDNYLQVGEIEESFEGIKYLIEKFGAANVYIVSKCGEKIQKKSLEWMKYKKLSEKTGLLHENIIFCRQRADKSQICIENKINFFIDDSQEVLQHMSFNIIKFLFPVNGKRGQKSKTWYCVDGWEHIIDIFKEVQLI